MGGKFLMSILFIVLSLGVFDLYATAYRSDIISNNGSHGLASDVEKAATHEGNLYVIIYILLFVFVLILAVYLISCFNRRKRDSLHKKATDSMLELLRLMPNTVVVYDKDLVIQTILNPQEDLLAIFSNDNLTGNTLADLGEKYPLFARASTLIYPNIKHTKETGEECLFTYDIEAENGAIFHSECKSTLFSDGRVLCFTRDVTSNVISGRENIQLKDFLQLILENIPVAVFVKDVKAGYRSIFHNENLYEFYGQDTKLEDGYLVSNAINEEVVAKYREEDMRALSSDTPLVFDRVLYDKNGYPYRYGMASKRKLVTKDGNTYILASLVDTTEIRKNQIELENARNEIAIALDAGSMSAWLYDVESRTFSSLYGEAVWGALSTLEDINEILHPDSQAVYNDFIQSLVLAETTTRRAVLRFKKGDSYGWYETYASGVCSHKNGTVTQIVGTQKDITSEIEKQRELKESKLKLELAFETAGIVMWDYNVEEDFLYSPSAISMLNKTRFTLENYIENCVFSEYRKLFRDVMSSLIYDELDSEDRIIRLKAADGSVDWAQFTAKVISRDRNGKAIKIIGTRKFITEIVETANKLKESNFKTDLILKSSGIVQWDYDYTTDQFTSPDPTSFMNKSISMEEYLSHVIEEDQQSVLDAIQQLSHGTNDRMNVQVRLNTPNGVRWYDIDGVVLKRMENGDAKQLTGFRRDITNLKIMTNELIVLRDKAEESNRLKSAFLANMSHEIRTPLNAIVGFSNLVALSEDEQEKSEFCKIIETNNELLLQLINDILDLSKIEAGQLEFIYAEMDVSEMLYSLEQIFKYRIKEGVELIAKVPSASCLICSEKNRLTQVMVNFLSNASKFTLKGAITIGYEYTPKGLKFYVTDTGKGIQAANIDHVFERFAKFDSFVQGTGLGLSICKTIITKLDGEIGVSSIEGVGSTFWFTIPCQILNESELLEDNVDLGERNTIEGQGDKEKTILIAEDNYSNYMLLYNMFCKKYKVIHALNGIEAVKLHSMMKPNVIIMDVKMPEMSGFEATRIIRETDKATPIIALTAYAYDDDREQAKTVGCSEFMTKPVDMKMLMNYLDKLFNKH